MHGVIYTDNFDEPKEKTKLYTFTEPRLNYSRQVIRYKLSKSTSGM